MNYSLQSKAYYRDKCLDDGVALFDACWESFLKDEPNYDCDEDVLDYLNAKASELVNDPDSYFYIYG